MRTRSKVKPFIISKSTFSSSVSTHMPRKLKVADTGAENISKWKGYERAPRSSWDEVNSATTFGSVRVDADNIPKALETYEYTEKHENTSRDLGGAFTETFSKLDAHKNDYLSLLVEEESRRTYAFNETEQSNENSEQKDFITKQKFSFGKFRENKTIPVKFENESPAEKSDMNYFDELLFSESFNNFSAEDASRAREVSVDPSVEITREQTSDPDLNPVDQEYFSHTVEPLEKIEINKVPQEVEQKQTEAGPNFKNHEDKDLNFVDAQFFTPVTEQSYSSLGPDRNNLADNDHPPHLKTIPAQTRSFDQIPKPARFEDVKVKSQNSVVPPDSSWFESDIDKLVSDAELKDKMKAKRAEHRAEKLQDLPDPFKAFKNPLKKSQAKTAEGPALEYVRKLRKSQNNPSDVKHPHETLGQHWQDRFLAATSNLQNTRRQGNFEDKDDDESTEHVALFTDVKKYKPPDLSTYLKGEVRDLLFSKIIYDGHDLIALWKPYGLPMFPPGKTEKVKSSVQRFSMEGFLPNLAERVGAEQLYEVHRLDQTTTGVVLYAKTKEMEQKLRKLFKEKKVQKTYICICNGVPQADSGFIDIPVGEGKIGTRRRMTLKPDYSGNSSVINNKKSYAVGSVISKAVTKYSVVACHDNASLLETKILSGKKHQIRLHLGLGLGCPILGDHKFSYPDQLGKPQNVKGDIVKRLNIRKSKSRDLPIFLHAKRISIPDILPDGNLVITASLPHFFTKTMQKLKLKYNRKE